MAVDTEYLKSLGLDDETVIEKITGHVQESEQGLISKRDELLQKLTTKADELKRFDGIDPDVYKTNLQRLEELQNKNLTADERLELEKSKIEDEYKKKLALLSDEKEELASNLTTMQKDIIKKSEDAAIFSAVGDKGKPAAILAAIRYNGLVETGEDGEMLVHSLDKSKKLDNIGALLEEMKASDDWGGLFNSSGLSGGNARQSRGKQTANTENLTPAQKMKAARPL